MASVRQIAKLAGVSKTTVSQVLRNQGGVSEATRQRVREALGSLRVVEEARAAEQIVSSGEGSRDSAEQNATSSLLVLHPADYHASGVFHEIIRGIQNAASLYQLQLNLAYNNTDFINNTFETFYFSNALLRPKGVIIIGAQINEPVVDRLKSVGIPVVLVGRQSQDSIISSVGRDEVQGAFEAADYLLELGHRGIAFLGGSERFSYTADRLDGYRKAFVRRGLPVRDENVMLGYNPEQAAQFLISETSITAALFVNELYASQVLPSVIAAGKCVPDDLSVIGFDDTDISSKFDPPLTSISFPFFQEGFWSVRILVEQVRQPMIASGKIVFRPSLVKRKSCCSPRLFEVQ